MRAGWNNLSKVLLGTQAGRFEFENSAARNFSKFVIRKSEGNARKNTERLVPALGTGRFDG